MNQERQFMLEEFPCTAHREETASTTSTITGYQVMDALHMKNAVIEGPVVQGLDTTFYCDRESAGAHLHNG